MLTPLAVVQGTARPPGFGARLANPAHMRNGRAARRPLGHRYLKSRYSTGSDGKSQFKPASAITDSRLAITITTKAPAVTCVIRQETPSSLSQAAPISIRPLAAI